MHRCPSEMLRSTDFEPHQQCDKIIDDFGMELCWDNVMHTRKGDILMSPNSKSQTWPAIILELYKMCGIRLFS